MSEQLLIPKRQPRRMSLKARAEQHLAYLRNTGAATLPEFVDVPCATRHGLRVVRFNVEWVRINRSFHWRVVRDVS